MSFNMFSKKANKDVVAQAGESSTVPEKTEPKPDQNTPKPNNDQKQETVQPNHNTPKTK